MDEPIRTAVPDEPVSPDGLDAPGAADADALRRAHELALARAQSRARAEQRRRATWPAMITSLLVVLGIVVALLMLVPRVSGVTQPPVDVQAGARAAAQSLAFTPSVPAGLPSGWRATSVRTTATTDGVLTWHVGYQTSGEQYAALEQGQGATPAWLRTQTRSGTADGSVTVAGQTWQRFSSPDGQARAMVRVSQVDGAEPVTTVVTGTAGFAELAELARSLPPIG